MKQITLADYWMGRDTEYPDEVTDEKRANAADMVYRTNRLLGIAQTHDVTIEDNPKTGSPVSSGFRPAALNAAAGGAVRSKHMDCNAVDIFDPDGDLDEFCMNHQHVLRSLGLYLEHPSATKGWTHVQRIAPRSGNVVFYP